MDAGSVPRVATTVDTPGDHPEATPKPRRRRKTAPAAPELAAPAPEAAASRPRRAVFIDVENTTAEAALLEVLRSLAVDPAKQEVELTAVGNWRAVPPALARRLATVGARLIHSAPARGVRDWSDLWIATAAGCWLGQARPGDVLEIVSNDRAFDAIGDLAAARGVVFRRIPHTKVAPSAGAMESKEALARVVPRRGRGSNKRSAVATSGQQLFAPSTVAQAAPADRILATIERLTGGDPARWVNLDVLERSLKEQGFVRPPGSPRLVTRLRALKQVEVDAHGRVRLRLSDTGDSRAEVEQLGT